MLMARLTVGVALAAMFLAPLAALADQPGATQTEMTLDKIKRTGAITLGVRESSYPLSYALEGGRFVGYHVDVCNRVVEAVKAKLALPRLEVRHVAVTSANRIASTLAGTIDLECGSTTNNTERQAQVAFAPTTFVSAVRVAVKKDSGVKNLGQLRGASVATTKRSTSIQLLGARQPGGGTPMRELFGEDHLQSFALLESGQAQAFVMDDNLLAGLIAMSADPQGYELVGPSMSIEPIAIMLRRNDPAFKAVVDGTVKALMKSGDLEKLYVQWFQSPIPPKGVNLNLPMTGLLRQQILYPSDDPAESFRTPE
ncbi:amino acid ABC transporter substrate-binding protein [Magnetospirillum moscoviense]|nr:amino acid ABC transporter substrate-binding protein [Magnetospirillum moscoviense]